MKTTITTFVSALVLSVSAFSQDSSKVMVVNPAVGDTIDRPEKIRYSLFPFIKNEDFMYAQFLHEGIGRISLLVKLKDGKTKRIGYTKEELAGVARQIDGNQVVGTESDNERAVHFPEYFLTSSAHMLKPGQGCYKMTLPLLFFNDYYFGSAMMMLNTISAGVTKNFSMGGGVGIAGSLDGNSGIQPILYISPKAGFKIADRLHAGAGLFYASEASSNPFHFSMVRVNASITYGSEQNNITLGGSYMNTFSTWAKRPVFTLSGMKKLGKYTALVSENWIYSTQQFEYDSNFMITDTTYKYSGVYTAGLRIYGNKVAADLGMFYQKNMKTPVPFIDVAVKFGGKK